MAEWRYSAGSAPAILDDRLVAVVVGGDEADAAVARVAAAGSVAGLPELVDLVLDGGPVAALPAVFLAVRDDARWRYLVRGAIEVRVAGEVTAVGTMTRTWCEDVAEEGADIEVRLLDVADDPWQAVGATTTRVSALRHSGQARLAEDALSSEASAPVPDPSATLAGTVEDPAPEQPAPAAEPSPPARSELELEPEPQPEPRAETLAEAAESDPAVPPLVEPAAAGPAPSRYDALFGELTVAGGVAAAAVPEAAADELPDGTGSRSGDTAIDFDASAVAVSAIMCAHHHANPPERLVCWRCSSPLAGSAIVRVPRPSLGRLEFDDGRVVEIDRTILVGRNPRSVRTDAGHLPELVSVGGDGVSRTHARIFIDGWQVLIEDLGSSFGTTLAVGNGPARRLRPGQPDPVTGDATVDLGGGTSFRIVGVP